MDRMSACGTYRQARGAQKATYWMWGAGRWNNLFIVVRACFHASNTAVRVTAIKIAIDNLSHIRLENAILSFKALFIGLFKEEGRG